MTDEQINAAITDATGLWDHPYSNDTKRMFDFCDCLNAMHWAEMTLTEDQMWIMARNIERNEDKWYFHATARQRAEAFLRTIGKWEATAEQSSVYQSGDSAEMVKEVAK